MIYQEKLFTRSCGKGISQQLSIFRNFNVLAKIEKYKKKMEYDISNIFYLLSYGIYKNDDNSMFIDNRCSI
jgi:hypothetical protein